MVDDEILPQRSAAEYSNDWLLPQPFSMIFPGVQVTVTCPSQASVAIKPIVQAGKVTGLQPKLLPTGKVGRTGGVLSAFQV